MTTCLTSKRTLSTILSQPKTVFYLRDDTFCVLLACFLGWLDIYLLQNRLDQFFDSLVNGFHFSGGLAQLCCKQFVQTLVVRIFWVDPTPQMSGINVGCFLKEYFTSKPTTTLQLACHPVVLRSAPQVVKALVRLRRDLLRQK